MIKNMAASSRELVFYFLRLKENMKEEGKLKKVMVKRQILLESFKNDCQCLTEDEICKVSKRKKK